jgi:hypothetical protein
MMRLGDFMDRVCANYGGSILEPKAGSLAGTSALRHIVRTDGAGKRWIAPIQSGVDSETLVTDDVIRSMCNQLGIDPNDFGIADPRN